MFNLYVLPSLLRVNRHTHVSILVRGYGKSWEASKHTFVYYTVNRTWNNKTLLYKLEGLAARFVRSKPPPKILHIHRHQHTQRAELLCCVQARNLYLLSQHIPYIIFIYAPCSSLWYTNYRTTFLHQCIVLKSFTL